ncbi:MAG: translocation/assembly module TamB domain-containing protein [Aquificaceae bacterium]
MRVLGYLLLFLLALYFILLKPYLLAKRVHWEVEGISLSFEEGVSLRKFLLYLPKRHITLYMLLRDVSLKPWEIKVKEFNLIEVSTAPPSDKPFDYDFTPLIRLAQRLNLSVEGLYISSNHVSYGESLTLFIPHTELRAGEVYSKGWTQAYWLHYEKVHFLEVLPQRAYIKGDRFIVERARVRSPLYGFDLKASWRGKRGDFEALGEIQPIEGKGYKVGTISLDLKGTITYTQIRSSLSGIGEGFEITNRRSYQNLRLEGEYLWEWRGRNRLIGKVWNGQTYLDLTYSLKDGLFEGTFNGFSLDSRLLGTDREVSGLLRGDIRVDVRRKLVQLRTYSPSLKLEGEHLENTSLGLRLDYSDTPKGTFEFIALQPFYLSYSGSFLSKDLWGSALLLNYPLKREDLSANISYRGSLEIKEGLLNLQGNGKLWDIVYKSLPFGSADYSLSLKGDAYNLNMKGQAFSLFGEGSIKDKSFNGRLSLIGMDYSYRDFHIGSLRGDVDLRVFGDSFAGKGTLSGYVSRENLSSWLDLSLDLSQRGDKLQGIIEGGLKDAKLDQLTYKEGSFHCKLEEGSLFISFSFPEGLDGKGQYRLKEGSYSFDGTLRHTFGEVKVNTSYRISGLNKSFDLVLSGEGSYRNFAFPIRAKLTLREGERIEAFLEGFTTKRELITLSVGNIRLYGGLKEGSIEIDPAVVNLGHVALSRVEFQKGSYREGGFQMQGKTSGLLEGSLRIVYEEELRVSSEGLLDLGRLFSIIRSRVLADAEGEIFYRFFYGKDGLDLWAVGRGLHLRSRYLALPLEGNLELSMKEKDLVGNLKFYGNQKASILGSLRGNHKGASINFEVSQMPVLLREQNMRASIVLSGKGFIQSDYRNLKVGGDLYTSGLLNLQKLTTRIKTPPEDYKRLSLDIRIASSEPIRVNIPEGFIHMDLIAKIGGTLYEPDYRINTYFKGGNLNYFGKNFHVRRGEAVFTRKEQNLDLTVITPTPDYSIIIDIKGNPQYPKALVRSEPPRDIREVITALALGGRETEGLIPVAEAIISQAPQLNEFLKGANKLTGLDVKVQVVPTLSSTGEVGVSTVISKEITERVQAEHRQSTLRDPKETYTGGEIKLTPNASIGGRLYSDRTQEYKVRVRRKFDF